MKLVFERFFRQMLSVDYQRRDKYVVKNKHSQKFLHLVSSIIDYAHISGKKIILEGIETPEDLLFAKQLNVDFVQGFLYRERFINVAV